MEIIKNIAAVVGCISACIALLITIFKPIRCAITNYINRKSNESEINKNREDVLNQINSLTKKVDVLLKDKEAIIERVNDLQDKVLLNEADRIKSELFACGSRCRRGIILYPEEFEHIRDIYTKYSDVLKQNHSGTMEYEYIYKYYNSQNLDN